MADRLRRDKFAIERYPFAPALRPIPEALAKLDPKPVNQPPAPKKPYVPTLAAKEEQAAALTVYSFISGGVGSGGGDVPANTSVGTTPVLIAAPTGDAG